MNEVVGWCLNKHGNSDCFGLSKYSSENSEKNLWPKRQNRFGELIEKFYCSVVFHLLRVARQKIKSAAFLAV